MPLFQVLVAHGGKDRAMEAWLAYEGVSKSAIGRALGVDMALIKRYWRRGVAPEARIEQLRELGIPDFLLPEPSGRPARMQHHEEVSA
jgi:hypothetical protein